MSAASPPQQRLILTSPWDPVTVRRGDPLGLRALADRFADTLAPDLSNRTQDARWISLIAWCLTRSHEIWSRSRQFSLASRSGAEERYAWVCPLELMWVARTIQLAKDDWRGRQLSGQRRVRRWLEHEPSVPRFAMSIEQYRRYRQTGLYGGYRVAFRRIPGLTHEGDGWTPNEGTHRLAKWVHSKLGKKFVPEDIDGRVIKPSFWRGEEERWWLKAWPQYLDGTDTTSLPSKLDDHSRLPEAPLLDPILFGSDRSGQKRARIASILDDSNAAEHLALCKHIVKELANEPNFELLGSLPAFSRLADAGVEVMDQIAQMLASKDGGLKVAVSDLIANASVREACEELAAASRARSAVQWSRIPQGDVVEALAQAASRPKVEEQIEHLLRHHEMHGGGLKWFVLRDGMVLPRTLHSGGRSSRYRFRLWSLGRLAAQCGRISGMPLALVNDARSELEQMIAAQESNDDGVEETE